ncbi:MAG: peptidoglycan DD-metalloendopeptidase family protein [Defluviitaleaceae bacterium]|nr:peptidoglycan DD-metalloendopeptidase family protein [Defluviitaleaceae bacterium]
MKKLAQSAKKLMLVTLAFAILTPLVVVSASSVAELEQRRIEVQAEIAGARGEYIEILQEMETLELEILEMDIVLEHATDQLVLIEESLEETRLDLELAELDLEQARQDRDDHFDRFKTRLRVMYIHGPMGYLEVVMQANSFLDFLARLEHMNAIARTDREMATRLQDAEDLVEKTLEETFRTMTRYESLQVLQAERVADLQLALSNKENFMWRLEDVATQQELLVRQLEETDRQIGIEIQQALERARQAEEAERRRAAQAAAERAARERAEREAREAAERAARQPTAEQAAAQAAAPVHAGGTMAWPVPGHTRVSSGYGNRTHPITRRPEFHTGVDIPAPSGTNIIAAESGFVIASGWRGGFGNTVIIDHGNGLTTLYGHNSRNLVSEGQWVNRGDVIARVGTTGISTGPHLHFEVRRNGSHISPNPFLGL